MKRLFQQRSVTESDESLMQKICSGDRVAFELLYERYFDKLVWFAGGFLNMRERAEDIVQEVFLKVIKSPDAFDQDKKFTTWIYTLTANACKNSLRNDQNRARILQEHIVLDAHERPYNPDHRLLRERIAETRKHLSEKENCIYMLRLEQGLSIKEIAGIMDIPEGSVKSGIYYLLKKLAIHLKEFNYERHA